MDIDCDSCTARGTGCGDCVVTVLLGAPPGWRGADPAVVPMTGRREDRLSAEDVVVLPPGVVVEFDEVERRAVRVLADGTGESHVIRPAPASEPRQPKRGRLFDPLRGPPLRGIAFGDGRQTAPASGCARSGRTTSGPTTSSRRARTTGASSGC